MRVLVADDQTAVRRGLATLIDEVDGFEVVAEVSNGESAVAVAATARPDVVLMDVRMPGLGGIEATRRIVAEHGADIKVLMVTTFDRDSYVFDSLRAGASGFVLKDLEPEELVAAIGVVQAGESLLAPSATRRLIAAFVGLEHHESASSGDEERRRRGREAGAPDRPATLGPEGPELSAREREVVVAVAQGLSNAEIASSLCLARTTVKSHISSALTKWGLRDRVQLVVRAFESGLVSTER